MSAAASTRGSRSRSARTAGSPISARRGCIRRPEPSGGAHARAGAAAGGPRPFLTAYNINLDSPDVDFAKRIARRVRESGGGLPKLQANGFSVEVADRNGGSTVRAQVSMNVLDFAVTPLW